MGGFLFIEAATSIEVEPLGLVGALFKVGRDVETLERQPSQSEGMIPVVLRRCRELHAHGRAADLLVDFQAAGQVEPRPVDGKFNVALDADI
jgi:hypothetical protein